jgi:hypothetical protein
LPRNKKQIQIKIGANKNRVGVRWLGEWLGFDSPRNKVHECKKKPQKTNSIINMILGRSAAFSVHDMRYFIYFDDSRCTRKIDLIKRVTCRITTLLDALYEINTTVVII